MILLLIFLSFWLGLSISSAYIGLSITAIVFLLFVIKRFGVKPFFLAFTFLLLGFCYSFINISNHKSSYSGFVYATKENYFLFNSGGEKLYVKAKNHTYDIGDYLTIEGSKEDLSFTTIESSFDFEEYLNKRGVYKGLTPKNINVKFHNFIRINKRREKLLNNFNEEQRSIIGAILFSDGGDSELSGDLKELHLARFLTASGLFISAFHTVFVHLFSRFMKDKYAEVTSIVLLSLYSIFTFPRFSVMKVMLFLIIKWINTYILKKKFSYLTLLSGLGIFCLLINHYLARQDSFILGFSIPLISYLCRNIYRGHKIKKRLIKYPIIYFFFLPFEIMYYNKVVILSLPLQTVMLPLFLVIAVVSLLCFFYVPIYPIAKFLISVLKGCISVMKPLSFGILLPEFNQVLVVIYYFIYLLWLIYLSKDFVPLHRSLFIVETSFLLIYALPMKNTFTNEVNFISVGQGDCTLVRNKNKTVLIDTGGLTYMDVANESLVPYLRKKRIYKIDAVIITHYDYDHYGALESLKKSYSIGAVADYTSSFPLQVGSLTINNHNYYYPTSNEENDKSLVLSFYCASKNFVIMGDVPSKVEKQIIKNEQSIPCDVLKVGHHGSNTSTCEEWLNYLKPKEAIISCGKNNKFGHPNKEVVALLNKHQIAIHRTDLEGTIVYNNY